MKVICDGKLLCKQLNCEHIQPHESQNCQPRYCEEKQDVVMCKEYNTLKLYDIVYDIEMFYNLENHESICFRGQATVFIHEDSEPKAIRKAETLIRQKCNISKIELNNIYTSLE